MLTKKSVLSQFSVEYSGNRQVIAYVESIDIFENGFYLGSISKKRNFLEVFGSDLGAALEEISGGFIESWTIETSYDANQFVQHLGEYWISLQISTGEEPSEVSVYWKLIPKPTETEILVEGLKQITSLYLDEDISDETATEEELDTISSIYPSWDAWLPVKAGRVYTYENKFYRARVSHLTQPAWTPNVSYSIWEEVRISETAPAWVQPIGSHDTYPLGFVVTHATKTWTSVVPNNVWEPGIGAQWEEVDSGETPVGPEAWVQPLGPQDAYQIDDTVTHNGQTWISTAADNVWEPGVYGWTVVP